MKKITAAIFLLLGFIIASVGQNNTKVHLSFCTKIISETNAELIITAKMDEGWHLYSFNPGGDGSLISPEITFKKNNDYDLTGKVVEKGKLETLDDAGIGPYHFYKNKVVSNLQRKWLPQTNKFRFRHRYERQLRPKQNHQNRYRYQRLDDINAKRYHTRYFDIFCRRSGVWRIRTYRRRLWWCLEKRIIDMDSFIIRYFGRICSVVLSLYLTHDSHDH